MKFTHTLCAAVLLGTLSSTIPSAAFAQEKSKAGQTTTPRTYSLKKNEQVRAASRSGGRAEFQDLTLISLPADGLDEISNGWIEIQNISTGVIKRVPKDGKEWIAIENAAKAGKKREWIAIESFSHGIDRSTPDLMLHCANAKDAKGGNQACDKPQAQKQSTKDDIYIKIEGIDGESSD